MTRRDNRSWTHQTVVGEITTFVEQHAEGVVGLTETTELTGDLGFDSLAVMDLIGNIEDRFELSIEDAEFLEAATLGDVVRAVEVRLQQEGRLSP